MGMGILPGFPQPPFMILASALGLIGYSLWSTERKDWKLRAAGRQDIRPRQPMESPTVETAVKGHKVISGGGVDSYALTLAGHS